MSFLQQQSIGAFAATPITAVSRFVVKTGRAGAPWLHAVLRHAVGIIFCVGFRCHSGTGLRPGLAVGSVELTDGFRLLVLFFLQSKINENVIQCRIYNGYVNNAESLLLVFEFLKKVAQCSGIVSASKSK